MAEAANEALARWLEVQNLPGFGDQLQDVLRAIVRSTGRDADEAEDYLIYLTDEMSQGSRRATLNLDSAYPDSVILDWPYVAGRYMVPLASFVPGAEIVVISLRDLDKPDTTMDSSD
jgi:hypothetical protein